VTTEPALSVVVQVMIPSERSGVMFTADPSTGNTGHIVIEAAFGQGEVVVSGQVEPDTYVLDKSGPSLLHVRVRDPVVSRPCEGRMGTTNEWIFAPGEGRLPGAFGRRGRVAGPTRACDRGTLRRSAGHRVAMAGGTTYLVQSRPITTPWVRSPRWRPGGCWCRGLAASTGRASGRYVCSNPLSGGEQLVAGEILVAHMTSPDWVPTMRRRRSPGHRWRG